MWLTVSSTEQHLLISVRDEGKGFHVSQTQKLFARFETNHTFHTGISTGIGLSLVKELLVLLHGEISVESSVGKGSIFSVRLPRNYSAFTSDSEVEFILKDNPQDTSVTGNQVQQRDNESVSPQQTAEKEITVLIIEDNDELRRFLGNILRREYVVLEACDGRQGWWLTEREIPDVVISDIMMPEMDGIEYLRTVKENHNTSHIPVILLSAKASVEDRIQGLEYGADDYISKPFSSVYLKARIQSILKQRRMLYEFYTNQLPASQTPPHRIDPDQLAPSVPQVTSFDDEFIRKVIASVEEQMQNPEFRIDDLADAMGMSRTVFYRKLKAIVGLTPTDFVKSMRLKRALQLLDTDQYTISEVAYMCGFTTPQYFSKVFKDSMNCSPKEYKLKRDS
ncbi:MAG: response regulator [Bacteroides sp.]|nr:response regulator [Bacteroides sp.]